MGGTPALSTQQCALCCPLRLHKLHLLPVYITWINNTIGLVQFKITLPQASDCRYSRLLLCVAAMRLLPRRTAFRTTAACCSLRCFLL